LYIIFKFRATLIEKLDSYKLQVVAVLLFVAFIFLSLTAARNIIFYFLLIAPVLALLIANYVPSKFLNEKIVVIIGVLLYISIVSNAYYRATNSNDQYGLGVNAGSNPIGASRYIAQHGLADKKCFSSYMVSSFLLWDL